MVKVLVFSMNRAMQLDACLRSLHAQCSDLADAEVNLLVKATTADHANAYTEALAALQFPVRVHGELAFEEQARGIVEDCEHVLFVVDDTVFVRPFAVGAMVHALASDASAISFSLRLGDNLDWCYPTNAAQGKPNPMTEEVFGWSWDWSCAPGDWGYPLELSSSLYRSADVLRALPPSFRNPNECEATMAENARHLHATRPRLLCAPISLAFSIPANRVQQTYANRAGTDPARSADALLALWQEGYRIDLAPLAGYVPRGCHEEVRLTFAKR